MQDALQRIGLSQKEAEFYLHLLQSGPQTTLQLAEALGEKRTNVYMVLDRLIAMDVVVTDDTKSSRNFTAADPSSLRQLLANEQQRQQQAAAALSASMPRMKSLYALTTDKPGVLQIAGLDGFQSVLNDTQQSTGDVLLIAGDAILNNEAAYELLQNSLHARAEKDIKTRAIFQAKAKYTLDHTAFAAKNYEVRFLGPSDYPSEMVIYDDTVLFSTYTPEIINTVITDSSIAATMRQLFEELWSKARP